MEHQSINAENIDIPVGEAPVGDDLSVQLSAWCEDLPRRLPGIVEVGLIRLSDEGVVKLASFPVAMPYDRLGYREAVARARATEMAVLLPLERAEDGVIEVVAIPLKVEGEKGHVLLLVGLSELPAAKVQLVMAHLEVATGWVMHYLTLAASAETRRDKKIHEQAFLFCAEMLDAKTPTETRQSFASLMAQSLTSDRVVLVRKRLFRGIRVEAVSGESRFDRRSRLNDVTRQAAHEAILERGPVIWRRADPDRGRILGKLAEMHGDDAAAAIPLTDANGRIEEVVVLHWADADRMPDLTKWSALWTLSRPILAQKDAAAAGFWSRNSRAMGNGLRRLFGPKALFLKMTVIALMSIAAVLIFVDVPNTLRADVIVADPDLRVVSAPVDGFLEEVLVLPGDVVTEGQVLARLDASEVRLRVVELEAQIARHQARAGSARRDRDLAEAAVAEAEAAEAQARLDLALRELDSTEIHARIAGVVLEGDLRERIGARLSYGQELMRIAPQQGVELRLSVRNRDADRLMAGLSGNLRLEASPETALPVEVLRVKPGAETIDGELRFVAFGRLDVANARVENGMQGLARLDLGRAPIHEVWLRPIGETIYMFLWRWMP
jgi:multidrug efflux pump subunit AcrA (membrane-fusion protein)